MKERRGLLGCEARATGLCALQASGEILLDQQSEVGMVIEESADLGEDRIERDALPKELQIGERRLRDCLPHPPPPPVMPIAL